MGVRDNYQKPLGHISITPNHGDVPTKLFESDAPKVSPYSSERIHLKAPMPSRQARAHTYIKNRSGFWYLYSFGSMGVSSFPNPNKSICKIWIINSIKVKILQRGPYIYNVYKCTHEHTLYYVYERGKHVYVMIVCMHRWNLFLAKHGFQMSVVHGTIAQSGAQTINTLL